MHTSAIKIETTGIKATEAENILITEDTLTVDLNDGRTISVPLAWYPRLVYASQSERNNWRLIGKGTGAFFSWGRRAHQGRMNRIAG